MAILDDKKWNILHIQNSFIVDPSGTCDLIHPRDQLTLAQLAELKNNDEAYDRLRAGHIMGLLVTILYTR